MSTTILISDTNKYGEIQHQEIFVFGKARLTVAELIEERVGQEVEMYNQLKPLHFKGLVQPYRSKKNRNTEKLPKRLDVEKACSIALQAFQNDGLSILINEEPITGLGTEIQLNYDTEIAFLKYVPLVSGEYFDKYNWRKDAAYSRAKSASSFSFDDFEEKRIFKRILHQLGTVLFGKGRASIYKNRHRLGEKRA